MDFLDSLDLEISHKRSHRVRSWYLYEQFKSLERNQVNAAQKLKDRSYQDRILRQELSERKARRKLYDQFGLCQSESRIEKSINNGTGTSLSASMDDFESFCEVQEDEEATQQYLPGDSSSEADSLASKQFTDDFKSIEEVKEENSYAESVNSIVENTKSKENFVENIEEEQDMCTIGESIKLQLETVKENIDCLENIAKLDEALISEVHSVTDCSEVKRVCNNRDSIYDNSLLAVWTRLVSFANQCMQLNHGNCYYDYSTQFLTAVLACDVLRRGVSRICNMLQPYISPIKYATDDSDASTDSHKNEKCKKMVQSKKSWNTFEYMLHPNNKRKCASKARHIDRKYCSDNYWQHCSNYTLKNNDQKKRRASEPLRSVPKFSLSKAPNGNTSSSSSIWPNFSKGNIPIENPSMETCKCSCHKRVLNPMLKLSQYLDSIMNDIDDSMHL